MEIYTENEEHFSSVVDEQPISFTCQSFNKRVSLVEAISVHSFKTYDSPSSFNSLSEKVVLLDRDAGLLTVLKWVIEIFSPSQLH